MISTENTSDKFLFVNSCGLDRVAEKSIYTTRPNGRVDYLILYIAEGECSVKFDGQSEFTTVKAGNVILFKPFERQEYVFNEGSNSVFYFFYFTGSDCKQILEDLGIYDLRTFNIGGSISFKQSIMPLVNEYALQKPENGYFCAALLLEMLCIISRKYRMSQMNIESENEKQIILATRKIFKHSGMGLTVEELAKEACLSPGHFSHLFKKIVGAPPHSYMLYIRMAKARDLLMNTQMSVREIGEVVGCPDQNYFSRLFKKYIGISPKKEIFVVYYVY